MKSKFIILVFLSLLLCSCDIDVRKDERNTIKTTQTSIITDDDIRIDTITIHGNPHEILLRQDAQNPGTRAGLGFGGIMHSPECWCLIDSVKNK